MGKHRMRNNQYFRSELETQLSREIVECCIASHILPEMFGMIGLSKAAANT